MEPLGAGDPRWIGSYRLLGRLGAGGMGRVYLGRTAGGRTVAVKLVRSELADDGEFRARFRQEVAAARRVAEAAGSGRSWTAPVLDADTEGASPWVATGYVAGPSLDAAVREFGPLPLVSVRALGVGLADALDAVHDLGLIHRDLKPSNVLLALDGPRLIDFGIARALDATRSVTRSGFVVGSPGFMSPEQGEGGTGESGPVGPATDVFALGGVLAFAATGVGPFGDSVSAAVLLYRVIHEAPKLDAIEDPALRALVARCLAKRPQERPTPAEVRDALGGTGAGPYDNWLPVTLAASIGRRATELLDVESAAEVPGGTGGPQPGGPEGFGAAPIMSAPQTLPTEPTPTNDAVPATAADAVPYWTGTGTATGITTTGTATARTGSRSLLLAGLGLAVALVLGVGLPIALSHNGGGPDTRASQSGVPLGPTGTAGTSTGAGSVDTAPPSPPSPGPSTPNAIPAAFLGTWSGTLTTQDGLQSETETVVLRPSAIGSENSTEAIVGDGGLGVTVVCDGAWTLETASPTRITVHGRLIASHPAGLCTSSGEETVTLNPDGTLTLAMHDAMAGNPSGKLTRVGT